MLLSICFPHAITQRHFQRSFFFIVTVRIFLMPHTVFFQSYFLISRMAFFIVYSNILRVIVCSSKVLLPNASIFLLFWFLFSIEMIFPFLFSCHYHGQITMPEPGIDRSVMVKASEGELVLTHFFPSSS